MMDNYIKTKGNSTVGLLINYSTATVDEYLFLLGV